MSFRRRRKKKEGGFRGVYLLPNLITTGSLFAGFYAIVAAMDGRFYAAAWAILVALILDGLDGRIARLTQSTSGFGVQYDSLADLVSFGVAPGILAYLWALKDFKQFGWAAAFLFVVCGALRLARFNVQQGSFDPRYFNGLPIPAAAMMVAATVAFYYELGEMAPEGSRFILGMMYVLLLPHGEQCQVRQLQKSGTLPASPFPYPGRPGLDLCGGGHRAQYHGVFTDVGLCGLGAHQHLYVSSPGRVDA